MASSSQAFRTSRREGLALAVTAVSFAALVGAGFASNDDPDLAGRTTLARLSGEVAGGVVAEWEQLRRDPALFEGELIEWALEPGPEVQPAVLLLSPEKATVARALLSESRRLDRLGGNSPHALEVVLQALEKSPAAACRAEARLFAIQLAVRGQQFERAAEQWELARGELAGDEALEDTSTLLLCALAAAPALSIEQRAGARDRLVGLWVSGALALPAAGFEGSPLREAYRERVQALLPESSPDARLEFSALAERSRALLKEGNGVFVAPPEVGMGLLVFGDSVLIQRRKDSRVIEGRLLPTGTVEGWLARALASAELLPDGFALDFDGTRDEMGPIVRERVPLTFGAPSFALRHRDPDSIITAVGKRGALLRAAFFALAIGVAGAGFSVFRALRRERHLAELKSTFVAGVSHELRTPVASILLMAENLENERVVELETRRRYYGLIRREAERLRRLVDDVLDFSRIERGKGVHLAFTEMNVSLFAQELEGEVRERVADSGGELLCTPRDLPDHLRADSDALRRATMNLVDNALRYSGEADIELLLTGGDAGGLVIGVRDRGRGVPAARLDSLFLPFERLESAENSAVAGTGLGLAIVREIAEGHGGRAEARLPDGPGLVVELHLPAKPMEDS